MDDIIFIISKDGVTKILKGLYPSIYKALGPDELHQTLEMKWYRRLLHISCKDHVTNEEVRNRIQNAIGVHDDLTMVKKRKLTWYGHISRSSGMAKTNSAGDSERSKKERKTEEEMGR